MFGGVFFNIIEKLQVGQEYTLSVELKANKNRKLLVKHEQQSFESFADVTTDWTIFRQTFTAEDSDKKAIQFYVDKTGIPWSKGDTISIKSLYLEVGDGSRNITVENKKYNAKIEKLPVAERNGYKFEGWYTAPTGGTKIEANTKVPLIDTTYYVHWTK